MDQVTAAATTCPLDEVDERVDAEAAARELFGRLDGEAMVVAHLIMRGYSVRGVAAHLDRSVGYVRDRVADIREAAAEAGLEDPRPE